MLSLENANVPASINASRPNRTSDRLAKPNARSPLSRLPPNASLAPLHNEEEVGAGCPRDAKLNRRQFWLEVQISGLGPTSRHQPANVRRPLFRRKRTSTDAKTMSVSWGAKVSGLGLNRAVHNRGAIGASRQQRHLAGELGFEPRQTESESVVLPLHHSPIFSDT